MLIVSSEGLYFGHLYVFLASKMKITVAMEHTREPKDITCIMIWVKIVVNFEHKF